MVSDMRRGESINKRREGGRTSFNLLGEVRIKSGNNPHEEIPSDRRERGEILCVLYLTTTPPEEGIIPPNSIPSIHFSLPDPHVIPEREKRENQCPAEEEGMKEAVWSEKENKWQCDEGAPREKKRPDLPGRESLALYEGGGRGETI